MKRKKKHLTSLDYFRTNIKWFMMVVAGIFIAGIFVGPGFGSYGSMQCGGDKTAKLTRQQYAEEESEVMARMGDREFKAYTINQKVDNRLTSYTRNSPGVVIPPEQKLAVTWSMLDEEIENAFKLKKAKDANIEVKAEEINEVYESEKQNIMSGRGLSTSTTEGNVSLLQMADRKIQAQKSERAFLSFLSSQLHMSPQDLKNIIRENLLVEKYTESLNDEAKEQVKSDSKKESIEIYNRIVSEGEDFAEVAENESDENSSASKGGLVEDMTRKDAKAKDDEYATALFTSEIGKVQEPLELEDGFYIIKVEDRTLAEGEDFENAKDGIIAKIKEELGITDEDEVIKTEVTEYSDEELMEMASTEGIEEGAEKESLKSEDQITDYMIKELYEKVTFRLIFIQPENYQTRFQANIKEMKSAAGIEIVDPLMKAYSYVADYQGDRDFDAAIEGFRAIREERIQSLEEEKSTWQEKEAELENAPEDNRIKLLEETVFYERSVAYANSSLAQIDYLIAYYMQEKIAFVENEMMTADEPDESAKETTQLMIDELHSEMRVLIEEAVTSESTPEPYYNAMLGDLLIDAEEWGPAYENWTIAADYGERDLSLLQRAQPAFNKFLDLLDDEAMREKAGKEFDKLQKNLDKALEIQAKQQEEWQAQMQKMIEEMSQKEGGLE